MQAVNTQTLVHVGVELVVIGGLTFWFQRKTSLLQGEIDELREKVAGYENVIQNQGQLLAKHDQLLRQILGGGGIPPIGGPAPGQSGHPPGGHPSTRPPRGPPPGRRPPPGGVPGFSPAHPPPQEDEELDLPAEELDRLLQEELGNLESSRSPKKKSKRTPPEFIELECHGDVCELKSQESPSSTQRLKKKNRRRGKGGKRT